MEIHKYKLYVGGENIVNMPQGAKILCVQLQDNYTPCLWAEVDTSVPVVQRNIASYCTGETFHTSGDYISTVQLGLFVVHFYDLGEF